MADGCRSIKVAVLTIWSILPVIAVPMLTIQPPAPSTGSTFTLTCEVAGFTTALMNFNKDGTTVYTCVSGGQTCDDNGGLSDYSEVDWSQTNKGIITISNADQSRDGGDWTCAVGGGAGTSVAVTLAKTDANCGDPTKPTNGQVTFTTTTYQSTATYSCDSGYTIDGTATTTCQADGTWSGSVPTCTEAQDPAILRVTNVIHGATATFQCSLPNLARPTILDIYKDGVALYQCPDIAFPCSKRNSDNDYSYVLFTDLGTASAKGTFTVTNADQTRDGGEWTCKYGTSLISSSVTFVVSGQDPAILSVTNVLHGATATFQCSLPNLASATSFNIYKDNVALYTCTSIAFICRKTSSDNDYSDVTFTALGTSSSKGTFTVANVDQTRDGGEWKCKYGTSLISSSVTFVVSANVAKPESHVGPVIRGTIGGVVVGALGMLAAICIWRRYQKRRMKSRATTHRTEERANDSTYHDLTQNRSVPTLDYQTLNLTDQATPAYLNLELNVTSTNRNDPHHQNLTHN